MPTRELTPPPLLLQRPTRPSTSQPPGKLRTRQSSKNLKADAPKRTLSPVSPSAMNRSPSRESPPKILTPSTNGAGTIRSVPNNDYRLDASPTRLESPSRTGSNLSSPRGISPIQPSHPPPSSLAVRQQPPHSSVHRSISTEFGTTKNNSFPIAEDGQQWNAAVGRANLGKSGRVIDRLMGENDMLKRDIKIERLRADDAKGELKMAEAKQEQIVSDYEAKLHDAAINKTLLKRRERQLADLKSQVDGEKLRTAQAQESERGWREAAEREKLEAKAKVDEATNYAALVDGRYNALGSHWSDQREELDRKAGKLRQEIGKIVQERKEDDKRILTLANLCDQQAGQLEQLARDKDAMAAQFAEYVQLQETMLADIKAAAKRQEEANEQKLEETKRVLGEMKWAINVQKDLRDP
ncbi:hypothetical protein PVAG01_10583 [Phlyctema vagabunda]|uniref:SWI5-dependent HO expression protein 3 n=1 Tax=Phlyctema vagabunda TaxID=108571 RepID=A0ABR4P2N4_9HELO